MSFLKRDWVLIKLPFADTDIRQVKERMEDCN